MMIDEEAESPSLGNAKIMKFAMKSYEINFQNQVLGLLEIM